jgi:sec-independent protein translocase protein TatB
MFDIGGLELLLIAIVGLLVIGPDRLPETLRTLGLWLGRLRRSFTAVKSEIEKEIGMDEVRRQLHNESVMEEMKRIEREVQKSTILPDSTQHGPTEAEQPTSGVPIQGPEADAESDATSADTTSADEKPADTPSADSESAAGGSEPTPPRPRSEAELEALHALRQRNQESR